MLNVEALYQPGCFVSEMGIFSKAVKPFQMGNNHPMLITRKNEITQHQNAVLSGRSRP